MTLKAIFRWKNPDSTADLNARQATVIQKGVTWGGDIQPGVGLTVNVTPSVANSLDGMTVLEDANKVLNVLAGQTNVIVLHAKYNAGGSPAQPTLNWHVYEESVYNGHPNKAELIQYGKVTLAGGAVAVTLSDIDTTERDEVNPLGRDWFRGKVANTAALPLPPPNSNREGDFYYVQSDNNFYFWDGLAWVPQSSGAAGLTGTDFNSNVVRRERDRVIEGSGILSGTGTAEGFARTPDIRFLPDPSQDSMMGFDSFQATVNGHFIETHAQLVQLDPKADRYDLVFLEVWRETVADPNAVVYERNPDGSSTYTLKQASDQYEQLLWDNNMAGNNFSLKPIDTDDGVFLVTKYRFGKITGCGQGAIARPSDPAVVVLALNIDGVAFTAPTSTSDDGRTWHAASTTAYDGVSWAIPISVVRRTTAEDFTINQGILEWRLPSYDRYIFPVYPVADVEMAGRKLLETQNLQDAVAFQNDTIINDYTYPNEKPSGFLTGLNFDIRAGSSPNTVQFYNEPFKVRVRGIEDWVDFSQVYGFDTQLSGPSAFGYKRELVYLKLNVTLFAHAPGRPNYWVSPKHRPLFPSKQGWASAPIWGQGYKRGYVQWELVVDSGVGAVLDEDDAMIAAGWQRGDASLSAIVPGSKFEFKDGGIWSRSIPVMNDDRVHPLGAEWAIPICLIHRRNSAAWSYSSNPNGTGVTRPDDRKDATVIHPDDLVDLRHLVDVSEEQLAQMLEADIERLMKGQLRTRMAEPWSGAGASGNVVAGSRILQSDFIGTVASAFNLTNPDGNRTVWSDAREFQVIARSWDLSLAAGGPADVFQYTPGVTPVLIIRAPAGAHLIRHTPSIIMTDNDITGNYLQFRSEPCWSTRDKFDEFANAYPSPCEGKMISSGSLQESRLRVKPETYTVIASDDYGRPVAIQYDMDSVTGTGSASWWVHYDRGTYAGGSYPYTGNYGLAEIPDEVHRLIKGPTSGTPTPVNLGTIYAVVKKSVAAAISVTITAADVLAASGIAGTTVTMMGFDAFGINYSGTSPTIDAKNTIMPALRDSVTIQWTAPYTGDLEVVVFFKTDQIDEWVEIGRGGKSVRAFFSWEEHVIDYGVGAPDQAFSIGSKVWQDAEVGDTLRKMPLMWSTSNPAIGPWELMPLVPVGLRSGYRYSNTVSLSDVTAVVPAPQQYVLCIVPAVEAPTNTAAQYLQVDYTYTPYQGQSASGGAVANPVTALPKLKDMLHGEVVSNSDFYATQSGPCSVFGGVDAWSGWPSRIPDPYQNFWASRFSTYNATQLVKPAANVSAVEWSSVSKAQMNTAAVLRMPFPASISMAFQFPSPIHRNMDFELDPGRQGAAAGYWSFAPGYPEVVTSSIYQPDQFINALGRLAPRGFHSENRLSYLLTAASYQSGHNGETYAHSGILTGGSSVAWEADPSFELEADCDLRPNRGEVVANALTAFRHVYAGDFLNINNPSGVRVSLTHFPNLEPIYNVSMQYPAAYIMSYNTDPTLTFPGTIADSQVLMCVNSGTVLAHFVAKSSEYSALSRIDLQNTADVAKRQLLGTKIMCGDDLIQSSFLSYGGTGIASPSSAKWPDLIRIPFGSGSYLGQDDNIYGFGEEVRLPRASGRTSLKGARVRYPDSWTAPLIAELEALIKASELFHVGYGRGLYFGDTTQRRYSMPVLVPGSGIPISYILEEQHLVFSANAEQPEPFPIGPMESIFSDSNRRWSVYDHGGQMAYVFYGMLVNPESDAFHGRVVMQISGGPTSAIDFAALPTSIGFPEMGAEQIDGTALDAFWPSRRPILKNQ